MKLARFAASLAIVSFFNIGCAQPTVAPRLSVAEAIEVIQECRTLRQLVRGMTLEPNKLAEILVTQRPSAGSYVEHITAVARDAGMAGAKLQRFRIALAAGYYQNAVSILEFGRDAAGDALVTSTLEELRSYFGTLGFASAETETLVASLRATWPNERLGRCAA